MSLERVYRRLSPEERMTIDVHGCCSLVALSPDSTTSLVSHILDGSSASKFIATCKTIPALQKWMELELENPSLQEKVVEIDVARLRQDGQVEVFDLTDTQSAVTDESVRPGAVVKAKKLADEFEEVFIVGEIPSEYVQEIPLLQIRPREGTLTTVYRRLRSDDSIQSGLTAKSRNSNRSVFEHISDGSQQSSKYISCCGSLSAMQCWVNVGTWRESVRVVEIDLAGLLAEHREVRVINLSDPDTRCSYLNSTDGTVERNRARKYEEVLIVGDIPSSYITEITMYRQSTNDDDDDDDFYSDSDSDSYSDSDYW